MADYVWTGKEFIMLAIGWIVGWIIPTPPHMYKWWLGAGEREETLKYITAVKGEHTRMQTLSSQTGSIAGGSDSGCAAELRALLDEQDKLLSGHVPTTLQRYSYNARWGSSDGWLDLTWRLRQSGHFRQIVRRLNVLQFLITVCVQSHEATHFLLADEQALLPSGEIRGILSTESLSREARFPSRDSKALVCAIVNAIDAILRPHAHSASNCNGNTAQVHGPGLDECIRGLGDLDACGCRAWLPRITEQADPSSVAAKMCDSRLQHVAQMCVAAQQKLENAEQVAGPQNGVTGTIQQQRMAGTSHPDGAPPLRGAGGTYSLAMQTPFNWGTVQTPFSGQAPAEIFNSALLWYDTPHGALSASQEKQVSSSEVLLPAVTTQGELEVHLSLPAADTLSGSGLGSFYATAGSTVDRAA